MKRLVVLGLLGLGGLLGGTLLGRISIEKWSPQRIPKRALLNEEDLWQRLEAVWSSVGVPSSQVERRQSRHLGGLTSYRVRLPRNVGLAEASSALEGLARGGVPSLSIIWTEEGLYFRGAMLRMGDKPACRILLEEWFQGEPTSRDPSSPKVAVILDDLGQDQRVFARVLELGVPLNLAILPHGNHPQTMASQAQAKGFEVMVHLPMEPQGNHRPRLQGMVLLISMQPGEIHEAVQWMVEKLQGAKGANNHMGSLFTQDTKAMETVVQALASRKMYFVDSLTTPQSVAYNVALDRGLKAYKRDVFLDATREPDAIREQFALLTKRAKEKGYAVGICHPYPETLDLLKELHAVSRKEQIEWVKVSHLPWN